MAIGSISCRSPEPATLGSSDPCADAPEPAATIFSIPKTLDGGRIDDFSIDGETAFVSVRTRDILESVVYRSSIVDGPRRTNEIARPRSAIRIAATHSHLYYEEAANTAEKSRLLFRIPQGGGAAEHVALPSEEGFSFLETRPTADGVGNVFVVRSFGGFYGIVRVPPSGPAVRVDEEPPGGGVSKRSVSGPFVVDRKELFAFASDESSLSAKGRTTLVAFSLGTPRAPRTVFVPDDAANLSGLAADETKLYVGMAGRNEVVPKDGGPHSNILLPSGTMPFRMAVNGGFVYADFQGKTSETPGLRRLPIAGGELELISQEQPSKTVAAGCYIVWSDLFGVYARRR
ncbi:MAG: hypothetical protein NVS3B20_16370 [Polyangiales bacterium]